MKKGNPKKKSFRMFFNYPSEFILPHWLEQNIYETKRLLAKYDEDLKFGINESFECIPFNLINKETLDNKIHEIREKFFKASDKIPPKNNDHESGIIATKDHGFRHYRYLLEDSFSFYPLSLFVKKGVSSSGKEVLVVCEEMPLPLFFFHTVYPLCWNALDDKNKFSISKHPMYPLFHRYMQEPIAIAMSLSLVDNAFGNESRATEIIVNSLRSLPLNFSAGLHLYSNGLHMRWKDWRDNSKLCYGKFDTIHAWIDLFSHSYETPDGDQIITLWAELFNLTAGEIQGLKAASKYAPIISENTDLAKLLIGLLDFFIKNPDELKNERIKNSDNPIAKVLCQLISKQISIDEAEFRIPHISSEYIIRDFIGNVMTSWSFTQDLHTGCFRIFGPTVLAVTFQDSNNRAN